ncbi:hypothetical protein [Nodularia sp. UHCC 0506]|nr:hypothetical protein [Nodularia sp. UHCC 0506]MEA5517105.1 hypothetical protein [Nodularia sp. UHCC 0506]
MTHYSLDWIEAWCQENGWTELFVERRNNYWFTSTDGGRIYLY